MRIASTIARYLLGLIFFVFGLNGFLHFIPMPMPQGVAGQFMGALYVSRYLILIHLLHLVPGILLLLNRYVPLALTLLGPIIINILFFHIFMEPSGLPMALIVCVLWLLTAYNVRTAFQDLFQKTAQARAAGNAV